VYCAAILEVGARCVFAWQAGKSALIYGTPFARVEVSRKDKRWDETIKVKEHVTEDRSHAATSPTSPTRRRSSGCSTSWLAASGS